MKKTKILIPVYNDWDSVFILLQNIDAQFNGWEADISVLIINDGSTQKKPEIGFVNFTNLTSVEIMNMKTNKGHSRCNAAGLKYISEKENCDYVILMDGDGEDRPEEIGYLLCAAYENPDKAITANRIKRSEGLFFQLCYFLHKTVTFVFTGQSIKYGNYSCLPKSVVKKVIREKATWNSFSGSLAKVAKDRKSIPSERGERYFGPSKMGFVSLLKHSLSIIAVFKTTLLIRSILFLITYLFLIIGKISVITLIPVIGVIFMMLSVIILSKRENTAEFNTSLENIESIDKIK